MQKRNHKDKIREMIGHRRFLASRNRPRYTPNPYATQSILGKHTIKAPSKISLFNTSEQHELYVLLRQILEVPPTSKILLDFSEVSQFKISAILIIYAHLEVLLNSKVAAKMLWTKPKDPIVENKMAELGFWELLGEPYKPTEGTIKICSVSYAEKETTKVQALKDAIKYAKDAIEAHTPPTPTRTASETEGVDEKSEVASEAAIWAISESFGNVWQHAYASDLQKRYPTLSNLPLVKKWWIALKKIESQLYMAVYDIGVGIPASTQQKPWYQTLRNESIAAILGLNTDCQDIKTALSYGTSRFKEQGRGNGLPAIKNLVDINPDGWLYIMSGKAIYSYESRVDREKLTALNHLFPGTMIQWNIALEVDGSKK